MPSETCETCACFHGDASAPTGLCRRYPTYVRKAKGDWCGEWRDKPKGWRLAALKAEIEDDMRRRAHEHLAELEREALEKQEIAHREGRTTALPPPKRKRGRPRKTKPRVEGRKV